MSSRERSSREGFTSGASIERERSTAIRISRDWSNACSSSCPHCGRARATMAKTRPRPSQMRRRNRKVLGAGPLASVSARAPASPRSIFCGAPSLATRRRRAPSQASSPSGTTSSQRTKGHAKLIRHLPQTRPRPAGATSRRRAARTRALAPRATRRVRWSRGSSWPGSRSSGRCRWP